MQLQLHHKESSCVYDGLELLLSVPFEKMNGLDLQGRDSWSSADTDAGFNL